MGTRSRIALGLLLALSTLGCGADTGEGMSCGPLTIGASQEVRDEIARRRTANQVAESQAKWEAQVAEGRLNAAQARDMKGQIAAALAAAILLAGLGYGAYRAAPMVQAAVELRKSRIFNVRLTIGRDMASGEIEARGYTAPELGRLLDRPGTQRALTPGRVWELREGEVERIVVPERVELEDGTENG